MRFLIFDLIFKLILGSLGDKRIIGGKPVPIATAAWQVDVDMVCGGSIISEWHILTAAHCIKDTDVPVFIHAGSSIKPGGIRRRVAKVIVHERYGKEIDDKSDDIAILVLENPLKFSKFVAPISLPPKGHKISPGTKLYVTGWGDTKFDGLSPFRLHGTFVKVVPQEYCRKMYQFNIIDSMICAGNLEDGKDTCNVICSQLPASIPLKSLSFKFQGDSGGPLALIEGDCQILVGITSFGMDCGKKEAPAVYTRVESYLDWIQDRIEYGNFSSSALNLGLSESTM